jgi:hypothetical protein
MHLQECEFISGVVAALCGLRCADDNPEGLPTEFDGI